MLVHLLKNRGTEKLDAFEALKITNVILVSMPSKNYHRWISLFHSAKFLGSMLATASAGEILVMQVQTGLLIILELFNKSGVGADWQHLMSSLSSLFLAARLSR